MKFGSGYRSITGEVWVSEASGRDGRKGSIEMGIYIDIDLSNMCYHPLIMMDFNAGAVTLSHFELFCWF